MKFSLSFLCLFTALAIGYSQDSNNWKELLEKQIQLGDHEKSKMMVSEFLKESRSSSDSAYLYKKRSDISYLKKDMQMAIKDLIKSINLYENLDSLGLIGGYLTTLADYYALSGNNNKAYQSFQEALSFLEKAKDTSRIAKVYFNMVSFYGRRGLIDSAELSAYKALELGGSGLDSMRLAKLQFNLGNIHFFKGRIDSSMSSYVASSNVFRDLNDSLQIAAVYNSIANLLKSMDDHDQALKYIADAQKYLGNTVNVTRLNLKITEAITKFGVLRKSDKLDSIQLLQELYDLYKEAESINNTVNSPYKAPVIANGLGTMLWRQKRYEEAIVELEKAISLNNKLRSSATNVSNYISLGKCYYALGNYGESKQAFLTAMSLNKGNVECEALLILGEVCEQLGQWSEASSYLHQHIDCFKEVFNKEKVDILEEKLISYESDKKDAENQLLRKEKEFQAQTISNQKYAMAGAAGGLGLLGFISYLLYRQSNERKKKNTILAQQRDQIDALHKDLAHRVKNNLFFVSTLMKMQANKMDNSEAKQAIMEGEARIEAMSLLHRKLNLNKGSERIDMAEYIGEICDNLRYSFPYEGKRPAIKFDSDELYIDGESAMRIGLIVNELVTNSFKHAFKDVDNPIINIHIKSINPEKYSVHYTDNGVGMESTVNVDRSESMGLKLIHTLTKQLDGYLKINKPVRGTSFEFEFKTKTAA